MEELSIMTALDVSTYIGKKVIVTAKDGEDGSKEIEGKVEAASELGILIKPKGRNDLTLIEAGDLLDVLAPPEQERRLAVKYIKKDIEPGQMRRHLLDRHGLSISYVNGISESDAITYHDGVDHSDLGHQHGERPKKKTSRDVAIEAAEAAVDEEEFVDEDVTF